MKQNRRRNLLVVRAGEESLHPSWLNASRPRDFDLLVSYYGDVPGRYREMADVYHAMKGPRWPAHNELCRTQPALFESYDYVAFACDDLGARQMTWNRLFDACRRFELDLAQPAIRGHRSHTITRPVDGCALRFTDFVEVMCPVMSRRAFGELKSTFGESVSGWGLDYLWSEISTRKGWRVAIIDAVRVRHSRPIREGTLAPLLASLGVDPKEEADALRRRHALAEAKPQELGRLLMRPVS
jgi:hypothetical protein